MKLNQIIAIEGGVKAESYKKVTETHKLNQKIGLWSGLSRNYTPKDDEDDIMPSEKTLVQLNATDVIQQLVSDLSERFDVTFTKEVANCEAKADVKVGEQIILKDVPVTYLLFLEKQLNDIATFAKGLPTLDPSESWHFDSAVGCHVSDPVKTLKTKKIPRNHILAVASDKHPAQVQVYNEDVVVGSWQTLKFSGAMLATDKVALLERVNGLKQAVKMAREEANSLEISRKKISDKFFGYIFGQ